jgi:hypothetical protein
MMGMYESGVVSVWFALDPIEGNEKRDVLKDLCGVEYYDIDSQEGYAHDNLELGPLDGLLRPLSYSGSYMAEAIDAARSMGIRAARWVTVQYDFAYDPTKAIRPVATDPRFVGYFPYIPDPLPEWAK